MARWLVWIVVCGCYDPQPPAGAPCGTGGACPSNQTCDRGDTGEPNEALPCAASKPDGLWGDRGCDEIYAVACEK